MRIERVIYQAPQANFFQDVCSNTFLEKMKRSAAAHDLDVGEAEQRSWQNNAPKIMQLLQKSQVSDTYVTFEYLVPRTMKRIDCMIYGMNEHNKGHVVHIELKQWSNDSVHLTSVDGNFSVDDSTVETFTGGAERLVAHPSQQVRGYNEYLTGFIEVLSTEQLALTGLAYCYNYHRHTSGPSVLYAPKFDQLQKDYRTYAGDELDELAERIHHVLGAGDGFSVFNKMMSSPIKPSRKLLDSVAGMMDGKQACRFALIEDQLVAKNAIFDKIRHLRSFKQKSIVMVTGGPGTGKTVIALSILADLAKSHYNVHYATKSASLISGINFMLEKRHPAKKFITGLTQFNQKRCEPDMLDVLLVDEAHRIEDYFTEGSFFNRKKLEDMSQIDALLRATKILVLFIDDKQAIRSAEVGSSQLIRECAERNHAELLEIPLTSQFRCNGADNYLDWLDDVLYNQPVKHHFSKESYDFRFFDTPQLLYNELLTKNNPAERTTSRLMAGFCWPWSKELDGNGQLVKDVSIGDFAMPWESHFNLKKLPDGYVGCFEWAYRPEGVKQIGCIYTAQGFEFDYAGVIIGPDVFYDAQTDSLKTNVGVSKDPTLTSKKGRINADTYIRNIYRVLMSRGMKGTYIYCCDPLVKSYLEKQLLSAGN